MDFIGNEINSRYIIKNEIESSFMNMIFKGTDLRNNKETLIKLIDRNYTYLHRDVFIRYENELEKTSRI